MKKSLNHIFYIFTALFLVSCTRLDNIEYTPKVSPETFLSLEHWIRIHMGDFNFILSQPSSSFIVYFVSLFDIVVAYSFLSNIQNQKSRLWWGIGLLLTGLGALFAGTSYQAFGYEIKCGGREFCTFTSWWEIIYELFSGPGMNAFLIASAYSNASGRFRKAIIYYAVLNTIFYCSLTLYGAIIPVKFFVSFEFLMLTSTPSVLFFLWLYGKTYSKNKDDMSLHLRNTWLILMAVMVTYIIYMILGVKGLFWENGIWFTENDVLHVGMVYWVYYIMKKLPNEVKDLV